MINLAEEARRKDSRSCARIPTTATGKLTVQESLSGEVASVVVGDVSQGGMRVFSSNPRPDELTVGSLVRVRVILANRFLDLPARVMWVRSHRDFWSAGLQLRAEVTETSARKTFEGWTGSQGGSS